MIPSMIKKEDIYNNKIIITLKQQQLMCLINSIGVLGFRPNIKKKGEYLGEYLVEACFCVQMENATSSRCVGIPIGLVFVD